MKQRYHEGLPEAVRLGWRLSERIKGISKAHGLNAQKAFQRFTVESLLWALAEVTPTEIMRKGGLLWDQRDRETDDGDILIEHPMSALALYGDVGAAARHLSQYGILVRVSEVHALDMGGKGTGFRIPIDATLGITKVSTHIDVGFGAFPEGTVRKTYKSLFKAPTMTCWAQPWEAVAADKLAACLTLGMKNSRLKDYADLWRMLDMDLDKAAVARALHATMRERKADMALLLQAVPDGLSFEYADAQRARWREHVARNDRGMPTDFAELASDVRHWWADVQETLLDLNERGLLERRDLAAHGVEPDDNVYDFEAYRSRLRA